MIGELVGHPGNVKLGAVRLAFGRSVDSDVTVGVIAVAVIDDDPGCRPRIRSADAAGAVIEVPDFPILDTTEPKVRQSARCVEQRDVDQPIRHSGDGVCGSERILGVKLMSTSLYPPGFSLANSGSKHQSLQPQLCMMPQPCASSQQILYGATELATESLVSRIGWESGQLLPCVGDGLGRRLDVGVTILGAGGVGVGLLSQSSQLPQPPLVV